MGKNRVQNTTAIVWSNDKEEFLYALPLWVQKVSKVQLRQGAHDFHEPIINRLIEGGRLRREDIPQGRSFLHRLMVNYIRHNLVSVDQKERFRYQGNLKSAIRLVGSHRGYSYINNRLLDDIAKRYPFLKEECENQRVGDPLVEPEDIFREYESIE